MARAMDLGRDVSKVVAVEGTEERLPIDDVNSPFTQGPHFLRIVGEELDALDPEMPQDFDSCVVAAFIGAEAQRAVGVHGVQAFLLQEIGSKLVAQTDAASLLRQIQEDASAACREDAQAATQLLTAIAPETAEEITGEAGRMEAYGHRVGPALAVADHDRHMLEKAVGLAEAQEPGILGVFQRNGSSADIGQFQPHV